MNPVITASWCLALAGIVIGGAALMVFRRPLVALRVAVEFFTAAGLLRLSVDLSWSAIVAIAALIAVRRVVTRSLTVDLEAVASASR